MTLCSGGEFQRASDPWLSFSPNGDLFQISLAADKPTGIGKNALIVNKSTDGGLTWDEPVTIIEDVGGETFSNFNDKETITADLTDSNFAYAVWDRISSLKKDRNGKSITIENENIVAGMFTIAKGPAMFSRTTDGGLTWEEPREIFNPGVYRQTIGNRIVSLPDGTLVNFFNEILGRGAYLSVIRSKDKGLTWQNRKRPIKVARINFKGTREPGDKRAPIRTGDFLPSIAVNRDNGSLYVVWQDARFSGRKNNGIAFSTSKNNGLNWSPPIQVNKTPTTIPPANQQAFTPSVQVADDGTVGVTYYDFRFFDAKTQAIETDYFFTYCRETSDQSCADPNNWKEETRLTNESFNIETAPFAGGLFLGDYEGLASAGNDFIALFSQTRGTDTANVFFRRIESSE